MSYEANEADSGSVPDTTNYKQGTVVTVPGNTGNLSKVGYAFAGWCMNAVGTGESYTQGQTFTMESTEVVLYAKWTQSPWTRSIGGSGNESGLYSVNAAGGGFLVAGTTSSGELAGYHGGASDVWIAKLDDTGTILWSKCFGGTGADRMSGLIAISGGYVLVGDTTSPDGDLCPDDPNTTKRAWAALFDLNGNFVRLNAFTMPLTSQPSDARGGIRATTDGGFIMAGTVFDGAYWYAWAVKFDPLLQEQWQNRLAANTGYAYSYDVAQKPGGNYLLCGYTESGAGVFSGRGYHAGNDGFVFELNSDTGAVVQGACYGGTGNDNCTGVVSTAGGGFYVVGTTNSIDGTCPANGGLSDMMLLKVKSDFSVEWAQERRRLGPRTRRPGSACRGRGPAVLRNDLLNRWRRC